jgi:hypothetical protein
MNLAKRERANGRPDDLDELMAHQDDGEDPKVTHKTTRLRPAISTPPFCASHCILM